jgi:hypothetical protein
VKGARTPRCWWLWHCQRRPAAAPALPGRPSAAHRATPLRPARSPTRPACARTTCRTTPTLAATETLQRYRAGLRGQQLAIPGSRAGLSAPATQRRYDVHCLADTMPDDRRLSTRRGAAGAHRRSELRPVHAQPRRAERARPHRRFHGPPLLPGHRGGHFHRFHAFTADALQDGSVPESARRCALAAGMRCGDKRHCRSDTPAPARHARRRADAHRAADAADGAGANPVARTWRTSRQRQRARRPRRAARVARRSPARAHSAPAQMTSV